MLHFSVLWCVLYFNSPSQSFTIDSNWKLWLKAVENSLKPFHGSGALRFCPRVPLTTDIQYD